jgi:uncharacterized protein YbjT (DUF2867 family)
MPEQTPTIAVCGATGRQGGAVTRHLLERGCAVRALTRAPDGSGARALARLGAEIVRADMNDQAALRSAFDGADGVYSVQNGMASGFGAEIEQGGNVARAARAAGVAHVVYGSAGPGREGTGVPSWEAKTRVEQQLRACGLPLTILRPTAFMELMTERAFYPAVGTWRIWPTLMGENRPVPWIAVEDLGAIAAIAFARPDEWVGRELAIAADLQTLGECRRLYREIIGHQPRSLPMPMWLFDRFTRGDLTTMWRWTRTGAVDVDPGPTRAVWPSALTVTEFLSRKVRGAGPRRAGVQQRQAGA